MRYVVEFVIDLWARVFRKKLTDTSEFAPIREYNPPEGMMTECPSCGFKSGSTEDWMKTDERNDRCPRCGEETPTYEL